MRPGDVHHNQVIEPGPESLEEKLDELRTFAVARLTSLAVQQARALRAEQLFSAVEECCT
jgi:hypothetical protein